jgi:hypothetical protein
MHHHLFRQRSTTRAHRRRTAAAIGFGSVLLLTGTSIAPSAGAQSATTTAAARGPATVVRIQLNGVGFDDGSGFEPEFHGTLSGFGRVEGSLKGVPNSQIEILGSSGGKIRVRAVGKFFLRTSAGTIEGTNVALMSLPIILTPAGPAPDATAFVDIESEQFVITAGTGRFRNATGTITMRGIIPEIPPVRGKRRFLIELSGEGSLQLDPAAA